MKICDFGLARSIAGVDSAAITSTTKKFINGGEQGLVSDNDDDSTVISSSLSKITSEDIHTPTDGGRKSSDDLSQATEAMSLDD